jgi:chromosome segregation ATPase
MRLKSLELLGFKSFGDSTSSISKRAALVLSGQRLRQRTLLMLYRWVMVEQSAKHHRGGTDEDVSSMAATLARRWGCRASFLILTTAMVVLLQITQNSEITIGPASIFRRERLLYHKVRAE